MAAVVLGVAACGNPGEPALSEAIGHVEALIDALDASDGDREAAARALDAWEAARGADLDALMRRANALRRQLSAGQQHDLAARWHQASERLRARLATAGHQKRRADPAPE